MGIFRRLGNIVTANVHDLLERCEKPELLLHQALRGMEETLRKALAGAAKVVAHERLLEQQCATAMAQGAAWRRLAESAVRRGADDAARDALRRQFDQEQLAATLAVHRDETAQMSQRLRRQIERLRLRLQAARRERDALCARQRAADVHRALLGVAGNLHGDGSGSQDFERMARKVELAEAETDALAELSDDAASVAEAAHQRAADAWIETELVAIKDRL